MFKHVPKKKVDDTSTDLRDYPELKHTTLRGAPVMCADILIQITSYRVDVACFAFVFIWPKV
jgi:hypothetical protein